MYQALYRKWRPQTFSEVCGQEHVTKTLRSQTQSGRFSHAYLFTGTRGTGKTTCAKLLARAVNCLSPKNGDPCNLCESCRGILGGSVPDVSEIDAASYSGVDHVRALREELIYSPVAVRRRVYIIDEVHMLSTGAFNALLKTLEEPPPHVLFILATTELHKVPMTIVSRCQRFAFRRLLAEDIKGRLWHIAQNERITVSPEALALLSLIADGALRDGINLLDQCAALAGGEPLDVPLLRRLLGLGGRERTADWLETIAHGDAAAALTALRDAYQSGQEFHTLLDELSTLLRDLLLGQMLGDFTETRLPAEVAAALDALWPRPRVLSALAVLTEAQSRLSHSVNKRLEAELCVLRLCGSMPARNEPQTEAFASAAPAKRITPSATAPAAPPVKTSKPPVISRDGENDEPFAAATPPETPEMPDSPSNAETTIIQRSDATEAFPDTEAASHPPTPADTPLAASRETQSDASEALSASIGSTDPRWRMLTEKANPFVASFLQNMSPRCENDALLLSPNDDFERGLLDADFAALVSEHFPGGLRAGGAGEASVSADSASVSADLDRLADRLGDLVSFE